jgi:hypothetical protein
MKRSGALGFAFGLIFVLGLPAGCSGTSSSSSGVCCTAALNGVTICLCGTLSTEGEICTSSGSVSSCKIVCSEGSTTETLTGTGSVTCGNTESDGGNNTTCGITGESCCTTGTACSDGCCDPGNNTCVFSGEQCAGGSSVCNGTACTPCGGAGEPCCGGDECTSGCCDDEANPAVCVAANAACAMIGEQRVCTNGECEPCGEDGEGCCPPSNTCSETDLVCSSATGTPECTLCGFSGEPCCPQAPQCNSGTCTGTTCP